MKRVCIFFVLLILCNFCFVNVYASEIDTSYLTALNKETTIYVSVSSGDDINGEGTQEKPYKTINHALNTIPKFLYAEAKIRVLAGDYSKEGMISIENFSKNTLTITAFDGVNDINIPNDEYVFYKFNIFNCDRIKVQGLKLVYNDIGDYGIYTTGTRFAQYIGIKDTYGSQINNGFGVTGGSNVNLENCLISNKNVVVSCNWGSKVVARDFDLNSVGNNIGLWSHGGSTINEIGIQAKATYPEVCIEGSLIIPPSGKIES